MFLKYCYISWAAKIFVVSHMWPAGPEFDMLGVEAPRLVGGSARRPSNRRVGIRAEGGQAGRCHFAAQ